MSENKFIFQIHSLTGDLKLLVCRYHSVKGKAHSFNLPHESVLRVLWVNRKIDHLCMECFCIFEDKYMCSGKIKTKQNKQTKNTGHKASSLCPIRLCQRGEFIFYDFHHQQKKHIAITEHFHNSSLYSYKELVQQSPFHHKGSCSYFFCCSCWRHFVNIFSVSVFQCVWNLVCMMV